MTLARIGYRTISRAAGAVVDASTEIAGYPARAAANELSYEGWQVGDGEWWRISTTTPETCNYAGVLHNLGPRRYRLRVWSQAGTILHASHNIVDDSPLMLLFNNATSNDWRIEIDDNGAAAGTEPVGYVPLIRVAFIGRALVMPHAIYGGHAPLRMQRDAIKEPNMSNSGQHLGESLIRRGESGSYAWQHLDPAWVRTHVEPFAQYAASGHNAFFAKWRPTDYPNENFYGRVVGRVELTNMGIGPGWMSMNMSVRGFAALDPEDDYS